MILQPDDFAVGMYITVLENVPYQKEVEVFEDYTASVKTLTRTDHSYKGNVLQILVINLPYLVCKIFDKYLGKPYNSSFDIRITKFISISQEYVDSMEVKS